MSKRRRERRKAAPEPITGASPDDSPSPPGSRRRFLWRAWLTLAGVAVIEGAWVVFDFLRPRPRQTPAGGTVVVAGPVDRFDAGSVTAFPEGRFYLVRLADGGFLALSRQCTHLGCTVPWVKERGRFVCPCHTSVFTIRGEVEGAPAPRPLDLFAVRIENKIVKVDIAKPIERSSFEPGQVTRL